MKKLVIIILIIPFLVSCKYFQLKNDRVSDVVVSVGDVDLTESELDKLFEPGMDPEDSIKIRQSYIDNWSRKQIMLRKAQYNLPETKEHELEQMIQKYREDLYINSYQEALVAQTIDSVIDPHDIEQFYIANQNILKLREPLIQYRLISISNDNPLAGKMLALFKKNDSTSIAQLIENNYSYQLLQNNDSAWTTLNDFYNTYPQLEELDQNKLLKKNNYIYFTKDGIDYHIYTKSVLLNNDIAPLEFVSKDITEMIYHQKKLDFLQELDNKLIKEAIDEHIYKTYEDN